MRGLKVLRTDTNHRAMCLLGNALTHYNYNRATWDVQRTASSHAIRISTPDRTADLHVEADLGSDAILPPSSPFPGVREAREFAAPLLYTFDYEQQTNSIIRVEGVRDDRWKPRPVAVKVHHSSFLEQDAFRDSGAKLANAFWIEDVPYGWRRGSAKIGADVVTELTPKGVSSVNVATTSPACGKVIQRCWYPLSSLRIVRKRL